MNQNVSIDPIRSCPSTVWTDCIIVWITWVIDVCSESKHETGWHWRKLLVSEIDKIAVKGILRSILLTKHIQHGLRSLAPNDTYLYFFGSEKTKMSMRKFDGLGHFYRKFGFIRASTQWFISIGWEGRMCRVCFLVPVWKLSIVLEHSRTILFSATVSDELYNEQVRWRHSS